MQIGKKILKIPPYLSTSWKNVSSLFLEETEKGPLLKVILTCGTTVAIPNLDQASLIMIFNAHAMHVEQGSRPEGPPPSPPQMSQGQPFSFQIPHGGMDGVLANFGSMMQHNSEHMHAPPLPKEILDKIGAMAKAVGMDTEMFPKPEPHCNCPHCQMARAVHGRDEDEMHKVAGEEEVTDEDLKFRDWEIKERGDKLYRVTNPLNPEECFDVFLGSPVGCTCGEKDCEHIRAVLRS